MTEKKKEPEGENIYDKIRREAREKREKLEAEAETRRRQVESMTTWQGSNLGR